MRFRVVLLALAALTLALAGAPGQGAPKGPYRAPKEFAVFSLAPKTRDEAATAYWELRAKYSRSLTEYDDIRFRQGGEPRGLTSEQLAERAKVRAAYDALDEIYKSLYGRLPPWPIHSMDVWYNPVHLREGDLMVVRYEPMFFEKPVGDTLGPNEVHFYSEVGDHSTGYLWAKHTRMNREPERWGFDAYDELDESSYYFDEVLFQTERTLEVYVQKGVVPAAAAAKLRDSESRLDLERTIQWTFMDPNLQEPLYHFRIQDSSRVANPVKEGWWIFKPTKRKLRLNVELNNPDYVPPERAKYGENAKIIEVQRLFKDGSIDRGVEAGFGLAARAIKEMHARPDGSFPPEVMIYGETTSDLIDLYREKYHFEIVKQVESGTWIIRIDPSKFYDLYGAKPAMPVLRSACGGALTPKNPPRAGQGS